MPNLYQLIAARSRPDLIAEASTDDLAYAVQDIEDVELLHWLKQHADLGAPEVLAAYADRPIWDNLRRQRALGMLVGLSRDRSQCLSKAGSLRLRLCGTYWTVRGTAELLARAQTPSESMALAVYAQGNWRIWGMDKHRDLLSRLHLDDQAAIRQLIT